MKAWLAALVNAVMKSYDVIVIGGGLAGGSFVSLLADTNLRIALIEKIPSAQAGQNAEVDPGFSSASDYDQRTVALSYGSRLLFENAGFWSALAEKTTPIKSIHISDRGNPGLSRLSASQESVPALGYVVANRELAEVVFRQIHSMSNVDIISPAELVGFSAGEADAEVVIRRESANQQKQTLTLKTALLVAADGYDSKVRKLAGIDSVRHDYQQTAVVCNVTTALPHNNQAYERFTGSGPLAFLPFSAVSPTAKQSSVGTEPDLDKRFSVVWTISAKESEALAGLSDQEFLARLQELFGLRQGRLQYAGSRQQYPLTLVSAKANIATRLVLLGNASHTLHPVAGQGFNLGLRDGAELAQLLVQAELKQMDVGGPQVLKQYALNRKKDQAGMIRITDGLARIFTYDFFAIRHIRNLGLNCLNLLPPVKSRLARRLMGLNSRLPRFKH